MEPIAERLDPDHVSRRHQAIQHFVSEARWSDAAVRERVRAQVIPALRARAPIEHLIIDDTTVLKSGRHSVGVAVQYCGRIHATANCQTLVSLSLSNGHDSLPVACDLYLPESGARSQTPAARRRAPRGALPDQARDRARPAALGGRRRPARPDRADGRRLWRRPGDAGRRARDRSRLRRGRAPRPARRAGRVRGAGRTAPGPSRRGPRRGGAVDVLARDLGPGDWQAVEWREGGVGMLGGRFAARRVRTAPSDAPGWLGPEEWLLIEDADEPGDRSHWLISLPADTPLADLVRHAKGRWRVEQDYRDLKQEVGLGHFEGRSWRGLNHHITLCLAAYGFLVRERSLFPPRHPGPQLPGNQPPGPPGPP